MSGTPVGRFEWEQLLRETPGISMPLRGVLMLMATYADFETGEKIKPSLTAMAERVGVSRRTLTKHVGEGVQIEWLGRTEDNRLHGIPSVYRLTHPEGGESDTAHPRAVSRRGGESDTAQGVSQMLRTTYTDTSTPTSTSTSTAGPTGSHECTGVGEHAWCVVEAEAEAEAAAEAEELMASAPGFE